MKENLNHQFNDPQTKGVEILSIGTELLLGEIVNTNSREIKNNENFKISDLEITPIESMHLKLPVFGYRIKDFAYLTDVKTISDVELKKLTGLDTLVINALRFEPHPSHLNVDEAIKIIELLKPKMTYFTHISHNMGFHEEVCKKLPKNVTLAYDGLVLKIN